MFALSRCAQRSPLPAVKSSPSKKRAKRKSWFSSKRRLTVCHLFHQQIQKISPTNPKDITNKSKNFTEKSKRKSWFTSKGRLTVCHLSFSLQCFPRQPIWDTQPKPSKPSPWRFPRDMRKCQSRRIWYICHLGTVCQFVGLFWGQFGLWLLDPRA